MSLNTERLGDFLEKRGLPLGSKVLEMNELQIASYFAKISKDWSEQQTRDFAGQLLLWSVASAAPLRLEVEASNDLTQESGASSPDRRRSVNSPDRRRLCLPVMVIDSAAQTDTIPEVYSSLKPNHIASRSSSGFLLEKSSSSKSSSQVKKPAKGAETGAKLLDSASPLPTVSPSSVQDPEYSTSMAEAEGRKGSHPTGGDCDDTESVGSASSFRPKGFRAPRVFHSANIENDDDTGLESVNQYVLLEPVGKGAFGVVWKAQNIETDSTVAVKVIPRQRFLRPPGDASQQSSRFASPHSTSSHDELTQSVLREIAIMKKLSNKYVVPMLEAIDDPRRKNVYLVMKFMPDCVLHHTTEYAIWLQTRKGEIPQELYYPLEEHQVRSYVRNIVNGLMYLHTRNVVHCDVKPENILVGDGKAACIADFGVSELCEKTTLNNMGTPAFFAPELLRGDAPRKPVDVWALGATVYAMFTGKLPFSGSTREELSEAIFTKKLEFNSLIPQVWRPLLAGMLTVDPQTRWKIEDVRDYLQDKILSSKYKDLAPVGEDKSPQEIEPTTEELSLAMSLVNPKLPIIRSLADLPGLYSKFATPAPSVPASRQNSNPPSPVVEQLLSEPHTMKKIELKEKEREVH